MYSGLLDLTWVGYLVVILVMTHITLIGVTVFLHRNQAHQSLELHPALSHFFRAWLWFTTGMVTKEWVAVHRKHHATCETPDDPHSPQIVGIWRVLFRGVGLYHEEATKPETLKTFGRGTPDDWMERNIYTPHCLAGVLIMAIIDIWLFGLLMGAMIFSLQMLWVPFWAAGVINGIGHYLGYRNFATRDESRNIVPWGIVIAGEELHNNHHAYASSARLSNKWYEFDIGWMYIRLFEMLGLAKVKKVSPKIAFDRSKVRCDIDTLKAIVQHRLDVMANFRKTMKRAYRFEMKRLKDSNAHEEIQELKEIKQSFFADARDLGEEQLQTLKEVLSRYSVLEMVYQMKKHLVGLWEGASDNKEQLVTQLNDWCRKAEESGFRALEDFSKRLRSYAPAHAAV